LISLTSLQAGSPLSYVIALALPALDAVFPAVPAETAVVTLGVTTADTADLRIALLVGCAALGAFAGDNLGYLIGRRVGPAVERRFFRAAKGARRRAQAERWLERFGMPAIIVCRFIPGGRTAVTLSCGLIGYPRRRFVAATAVAAVIWAAYSFFLGRLGGQVFEHNPWAGLAAAIGTSVILSGLIEAARRLLSRRPGTQTSPPQVDGHSAGRRHGAPGAAMAAASPLPRREVRLAGNSFGPERALNRCGAQRPD
jgi:membrane protein DedA with SNARE-associated domain